MHDALAPWRLRAREPLQDCRVFRVQRITATNPRTDRDHAFYTLDAGDWVNVIALTDADEVVMVRQFRHGNRAVTLEIPGGMVDAGEHPADAASRELLEETGYGAGVLEKIGVVNPNPALFGNRCHTYLARGVRSIAPVQNSASEATMVELVPLSQVPGRIARGAIDHALVIAAFHWLSLTAPSATPASPGLLPTSGATRTQST